MGYGGKPGVGSKFSVIEVEVFGFRDSGINKSQSPPPLRFYKVHR